MPDESAPGLAEPALVVLVGPSGAGKSTWAAAHYARGEIVSSDQLRGVVGTGPHDLDASADAFRLLEVILRSRLRRGLTTVVDTLGLDAARRREYLQVARVAGLRCAVVLFRTPVARCRSRNAARDVPVPAAVLTAQVRRLRQVEHEIAYEGWDLVVTVQEDVPAVATGAAARPDVVVPDGGLEFILQISRFPWGTDPAGWLAGMARAAAESGFAGVALMDHLIQIPQVGRAWDPIPEPWVTLGLLAGLDLGLKLGTLVSPVTFRPPGIVAKAAATLDVLSGGRAFCGLGAGWWDREHAGFGLPFPNAKKRLDDLESAIETIRALWSPGTKSHAGQRVQLPETTCYPRPIGRIPIIVGGGGERRTLRIAAMLADACNLSGSDEVLAHKIDVLRRHCRDVGRDSDEVAVTVLDLPILGSDREDVLHRIERLRGRRAAATLTGRAGTPDQQIVRYRRLADLGARTVFVSPEGLTGPDDVRLFDPVVRTFQA
ncbi:alkanesulfonate monooxygenase SsuD/methylene tetrahydromethanopterin reductase-like flavin-dependent oxidoreductase (luciferase family)/predicted kinase [Nakamurella sp. UYEF19]|uniref:LLM class flavin-dependent oxidoreductase n=1 Tax=Nakamurella sp. UYEF19 TaxID=1756392 RepID=UPI003395F627